MSTGQIFAHHAHVFPGNVHLTIPEKALADFVSRGSISNLLSLMKDCLIARAVVFAPFPMFCRGTAIHPNRWLAKEISEHLELIGFGVIDFERDDVQKQVEEIKDLGLRGIKLHPAAQRFCITSPKAFEVYGAAQRLNLPISFHTGVHWYRLRENHPLLFDEVAYHFPKLKFSMEHVGGYHFFEDAVAVIMNNFRGGQMRFGSNIYAGLTNVFHWTKTANFWYLGKEKVKKLLDLIGDDFVIFGLDFPFVTASEIKESIRIIEDLDVTQETKDKILGINLERFLDLNFGDNDR